MVCIDALEWDFKRLLNVPFPCVAIGLASSAARGRYPWTCSLAAALAESSSDVMLNVVEVQTGRFGLEGRRLPAEITNAPN